MGIVTRTARMAWLAVLGAQWLALLYILNASLLHFHPHRFLEVEAGERCSPTPLQFTAGPREKSGKWRAEVMSAAWWCQTRSVLASLRHEKNTSQLLPTIDQALVTLTDLHRAMEAQFDEVSQADGVDRWRRDQSEWLHDLVQKRLYALQHPQNCDRAWKLIFTLYHNCGFGCQLHFLLYSLAIAYAQQRTLVVYTKGWPYASEGWHTAFQPIGACKDQTGDNATQWTTLQAMAHHQVVHLPRDYALDHGPRSLYPSYVPWGIPSDLLPRLRRVHDDPGLWWMGQLLHYILRPQRHLAQALEGRRLALGFRHPVVGVHVRRTDKLTGNKEGEYHSVKEYMKEVEGYYRGLTWQGKSASKVRVFLATDDATVTAQTVKLYPAYEILSDRASTRTAGVSARNESMAALYGIMSDIDLLARADHIVCTLSSNVCRRAYELMQTYHVNAVHRMSSLQWDYTMHLPTPSLRRYCARLQHRPQTKLELAVRVNDTLLSHPWTNSDGRLYMTNERTNRSGLVPLYKLELLVQSISIPVASNTL